MKKMKSSEALGLPVRVHADLSLDCDVLSRFQPFEYTAFVRQTLKYNIII